MNYYDLNSQPLNQTPEPLDSSNFINFVNFNGVNLNNCWDVIITGGNYLDLWDVDLQTYNSPFQDWWGVLSSYITEKTITFTLFIKKDTTDELYSFIDDLKRQTNKQEWKLVVDFWELRYTYATLTDLQTNYDPKEPNRINDLNLTFVSKTPHFISLQPKSFAEDVTTNTYSLDLNNTGSEETFYNFTIVWSAGHTTNKIEINNGWYTLTINTAMTVWDVLQINGENKTVKKNWTIIDYDWIFTELDKWSNPMNIVFTWTVNCSVSTYFYIKYR